MNRVILSGRLVKDIELQEKKEKKGDKKVYTNFTLAVQRNKEEADFIDCVAFGNTAEFLDEYTSKGTKILIEGSINKSSYEDKDGNTVYNTKVIVFNVEFADSKKSKE